MVTSMMPDRGDIIMLDLHFRQGHEQGGRRPALVLSPKSYNARVGMAILCPITRQAKGYPMEVPLPAGMKTIGVILADQITAFDFRYRGAVFIEHVSSPEVIAKVVERIDALIQ